MNTLARIRDWFMAPIARHLAEKELADSRREVLSYVSKFSSRFKNEGDRNENNRRDEKDKRPHQKG